MTTRTLTWLLVVLAIHGSHQRSTPASSTYRGGVVEFQAVFFEDDPTRTLTTNAAKIIGFIDRARNENVDIIVFPEGGLAGANFTAKEKFKPFTTLVPDPSQNYIPCNNTALSVSEVFKNISCAAARNSIYVVINLPEKVTTAGPEIIYYNTNVVFDRNGKIIARYRKTNLFHEPVFNVTKMPEHSTFDTDFGVTFGMFICADILYREPAIYLTRTLNIKDIVYSDAWFSTTPFLSALQIQAGWSFAEDVNFLAAGYNRIQYSNAGSGIYLGRQGVGKAIVPFTNHSELVVFDIPKKTKENKSTSVPHDHHADHQNHNVLVAVEQAPVEDELYGRTFPGLPFSTYRESLEKWETKMIEKNDSLAEKLCHNKICCEFSMKIRKLDPIISYRLVAFDGILSYDTVTNSGLRVCAVVQCANDKIDSCGDIRISQAIFESISVQATYDYNANSSIMPNTLTTELRPFDTFDFDEHKHDKHIHVTISTKAVTKNLVTFGLYGRNFDKDGTNSASTMFMIRGIATFLPFMMLLNAIVAF